MASTLTGRRALVTGAAGGIGAAIARRLLRDGAQVMIADVDAESLRQREAAAARQPIARQCSPDEIAAAVAFLSSPDASFIPGALLPVDGGFLAQGDWRGPGQAA